MNDACQFLRYSCRLWIKWVWFQNHVSFHISQGKKVLVYIQQRWKVYLSKFYNIKRSLGRGLIYFKLCSWLLCSTSGISLIYIAQDKQKTNQTKTQKQTKHTKNHCIFICKRYQYVTTNVQKTKRLNLLCFSAKKNIFLNWKQRNITDFFIEKTNTKKPRFCVSPVVLGTWTSRQPISARHVKI